MNLSEPFIRRPVGTTLLTVAITLAGALAYFFLPVSPLPQVDFPTIQVSASLPGASPETMASAVATPLERSFGRIAGVTEMTSMSYLGMTNVTLQFDLNRSIDAAARDVQAAINAARGKLPANLPNNPTYRKVNPADAPIMILELTSDTYTLARMYDAAASILQQKLSQVRGVGQVIVGGGSPPGVRVEINPTVLHELGLGLDDIRLVLANANANRPKGQIADDSKSWSLSTTDQIFKAKEYKPLIVSYRNNAPVRLQDIADVKDDVEDIRAGGLSDGHPAIVLIIFRQPGANIIATVDRITSVMDRLRADIPAGMNLNVAMDRTATIRASVHDVQMTLMISVGLVILVVFLFLRNFRATIIPSIVVPVSLISTFGVMYLAGYSIDNLSLMALTIATGFVVDDAIVVIENIARYLEKGMSPLQASLKGASEVSYTVLTISISLVAVFIPILLMGGIVGRLFQEFAVTLSVAIAISLVVSLTTTPMMCATLLKPAHQEKQGRFFRASEAFFDWIISGYESTLKWVLRHQRLTMAVTLITIGITIYCYVVIPKGFFPQQDTGRIVGSIVADQDTSSKAMKQILARFVETVGEDPAVSAVTAFYGGQGGVANTGRMYVTLKPLSERRISADAVVGRLRGKLTQTPGASLFLQPVQDLRIGGRISSAQYQFTLKSDDLRGLTEYGPKVLARMRKLPSLVDVNSDQQNGGLEANLTIDRTLASSLGVSQLAIDDALYDAFGQRMVSTMYTELNQYHVVIVVQPKFWEDPAYLQHVYVRSKDNIRVPLSAFSKVSTGNTPLAINHSGQFPSVTISFNLAPGASLSDAMTEIDQMKRDMGLPLSISSSFAGTAQEFQKSLQNEPILILAALVAVYIVLGILYESYIHPITILSTLPSAGLGALLALLMCRTELNVMGLIGILLLIGIVKKNAIMMIDFALEAERRENLAPEASILQACVLRFRPIVMTTMAALLGALPLAIGTGNGAELRRPLGIAIVGGLLLSQILTLYTTPVVYLYLDHFRIWWESRWKGSKRRSRTDQELTTEPV
jgi:multidrug efflux pump